MEVSRPDPRNLIFSENTLITHHNNKHAHTVETKQFKCSVCLFEIYSRLFSFIRFVACLFTLFVVVFDGFESIHTHKLKYVCFMLYFLAVISFKATKIHTSNITNYIILFPLKYFRNIESLIFGVDKQGQITAFSTLHFEMYSPLDL